jgi:hypothetical protein
MKELQNPPLIPARTQPAAPAGAVTLPGIGAVNRDPAPPKE